MIKEGTIIGTRYEIMDRIGTGGMADVYKAVDKVLKRYVAVKVLKREFREDEIFVKKFRSEAQAAAGLTHPNIVNVYDVAEDRGLYYIVMELVEGITLKEYIEKKGKLTPKEVIGITMQVCAGIDTAHSNRIIHRDIKPQNIMISKEGKVKVTDFGIAKATSSNTISTNAMGSVHYTSPEQARGGYSDERSDIYSLGITMYEMITGQLPFDGDSTVSIALKHLQEDIIPPSDFVPDMPYSLEQIILKCTQKSPDRRYADAALLARDLKRSIQDPDGDFVKISPLMSVADTVMITSEELEHIQGSSKFSSRYDDEDYDDYYDEDERRKRKRQENAKKGEIDPKMTKVMKTLTIVAAVVFVLVMVGLIAGAIGIFSGNVGPGVTPGEDKNRVPDMIGMTLEEAKEACSDAGITLVVDVEEKALKYDKNIVFKQLTQEGTKMPEGAKVHVHVSTGYKDIMVQDVAGKGQDAAIRALEEDGFNRKNMKVKTEESKTVKKGLVIKTDPEAGEVGNYVTNITIYVSSGVGKTKMPDLVGKTKSQAEKLLKDAGLVGEAEISEIEDLPDENVNMVMEQAYEADTELDKGTTVKYTVAVRKLIQMPEESELLGKTYAEVVKILEKLDVRVIKDSKGTASTKYNEGLVAKVDEAGKKVEPGTTITVYLSTGPGPGNTTPPEGE